MPIRKLSMSSLIDILDPKPWRAPCLVTGHGTTYPGRYKDVRRALGTVKLATKILCPKMLHSFVYYYHYSPNNNRFNGITTAHGF